jgi:hypothetical protein
MLHELHCKKCGTVFWADLLKIDLNETDPITVLDRLHCPGNHVELSSPSEYLEFTGKSKDGNAPTEEDWLIHMEKQHGKLYPNDGVQKHFSFKGFAAGMAFAIEKATGREVTLDFTSTPSGKTRYYWVA